MAATDQFYRNQRTLDTVFGVSSVLMLVSLFVMFYQDQKKEWKDEQRLARDVEETMAQRALVSALPPGDRIKEAEAAVEAAQRAVDEQMAEITALERQLEKNLATKVRAEAEYQAKKADYDSFMSLLSIDREHRNAADEAHRASANAAVERREQQIKDLKEGPGGLNQRLREFEAAEADFNATKAKLDGIKQPLTVALAELKRLYTEFDRNARQVAQKRWGWGDAFRNLPVIDAFNAPLRIHQFTLEELPIEYGSFKYVTRYDRCMSCHIAIDRPAYTRDALANLKEAPSDLGQRLEEAKESLQRRREVVKDEKDLEQILKPSDLGDLRTLPQLSEKHLSEFSAHPRLDLFVDDNSPHPKEKFGCTICHGGQGSATAFNLAAHTPNTSGTMERWVKDYHWASPHYWDFPMLPKRFVESNCVKCHHQITDLVREGSKEEAPKLLRGYNLVKENGCFGCHEISGTKGGRSIGPDLRLEPWPPLDALTPAERVKATSDPLNPPGTMRKVGPSLRRLAEKTHAEWVRKWIHNPRDFRPDTKMPHFYGVSNNTPDVLPEGQKGFPDAEIHAVTHYLMNASRAYLEDGGKGDKDPYRRLLMARVADLKGEAEKANTAASKAKRAQELDEAKRQLELYNKSVLPPLDDKRLMLDGGATVALPAEDKDQAAQMARGRQLFTERGCLACHSHKGTETAAPNVPAVRGDAQFGPNLSQLTAKLLTKPDDRPAARRWLVQWIMNPNVHHPRTVMPITHLTIEQAADIAAWLLGQNATWKADDVPEPTVDTLKSLARVWLEKSRTQAEIDDLLAGKNPDWLKHLRPDSDENFLKDGLTPENLKMYVGKKAVGNLGCYACHDIPGFESAKPIGTALNDWGKKDAERLAFEDIGAFVEKHYHKVAELKDYEGTGPAPYDAFYHDQLEHRTRIGFLHQKLREPRSYDFDRTRKWDERLRMPQFKFGRVDRRTGESDADFAKRTELAEAEAREAVMTFILGLVAEPIPAKYVNAPKPDRHAEVVGRQVLDKFNCAGCHVVRAGVYEFKKNEKVLGYLDEQASASDSLAAREYGFGNHTVWAGRPQTQADRIVARGVPLPIQPDEKTTFLRLTEALKYTDTQNRSRDIIAGLNLAVGDDIGPADVLSMGRPYGGVFTYLMVPYVKQRGFDGEPQEALPPPLLRQGEKTQPEWLFRFLRNPHAIRPLTIGGLRMPKFNMSEDEAMALVNYFAAADKLNNPAEGLTYPYLPVPQRDDAYWQVKSREYVGRLKQYGAYDKRVEDLKPIWEEQARVEQDQLTKRIAAAEVALKDAKDDATKKLAAQQLLDDLKRQRPATAEDMRRTWEERDAYAADAHRLVFRSKLPCLDCHRAGNVPSHQREQGPPLELSWERLRPDWTEKWLANPTRMLSHPTRMPQNFLKTDADPQGLSKVYPEFLGSPLEQATAVRDLLLNLPRITELPVNRSSRPAPSK